MPPEPDYFRDYLPSMVLSGVGVGFARWSCADRDDHLLDQLGWHPEKRILGFGTDGTGA